MRSVFEVKDTPERDDIEELVNNITNPRDKALVSLLFLTGARISEVVKSVRKKDIRIKSLEGRDIVVFNIFTKKRRKALFRKIPVPRNDRLLDSVMDYIRDKKENDLLFDFTRQWALYLIKKYERRYWLHLLRHSRLTELASEKDFTDQQLTAFAGWSDSRPSKFYVHLRWKDLARKLM